MRIADHQISDELKEMIKNSIWVPEKSGWRPFETKDEAEVVLRKELLQRRGSSWLMKCDSISENGASFTCYLPYKLEDTHKVFLSFRQMFERCKIVEWQYPVGVPLEQGNVRKMIDANGDHDDDKEVEIDHEWLRQWCNTCEFVDSECNFYELPETNLFLYFDEWNELWVLAKTLSFEEWLTTSPRPGETEEPELTHEEICYLLTRGHLRSTLRMLGIPSDIGGRQVITSGDWANAWDTLLETILINLDQMAEINVARDIIYAVIGIIDDNDPRPINSVSPNKTENTQDE